MSDEEIKVFIDGVVRYFERVTGEPAEVDPPYLKGEDSVTLDFTGVIGISGRHRGCHALIKDGARLVETVDDVLDELKWPASANASARLATPEPAATLQLSGLEGTMAAGEPYSVDELAQATGRPVHELLAELGALEMAGRIARRAGSVFVRT